jgi:hypothetical protein
VRQLAGNRGVAARGRELRDAHALKKEQRAARRRTDRVKQIFFYFLFLFFTESQIFLNCEF